jgi:hypothetical protein
MYFLLLYYIWSEIKSSKDILIQLKKIFIAPIILLILLIQNLLTLNEIDIFVIYSCLISILIGITTSYLIIFDTLAHRNLPLIFPLSNYLFLLI